MNELKLYPLKRNLQLGLAVGVGLIGLGAYLSQGVNNAEFKEAGYVFFPIGLWLMGDAVWRLIQPRPVFEADMLGFSVRGGRKRPWNEYRSTTVWRARSGLFTVAKYVRIHVGKSFFGGAKQIHQFHLSAPADQMAGQIEGFAMRMKAGAEANIAKYHVPPLPATNPEPVPQPGLAPAPQMAARRPAPAPVAAAQPVSRPQQLAPERALAAAMRGQGNGPIRSVPTLTERLFGRSKTI